MYYLTLILSFAPIAFMGMAARFFWASAERPGPSPTSQTMRSQGKPQNKARTYSEDCLCRNCQEKRFKKRTKNSLDL